MNRRSLFASKNISNPWSLLRAPRVSTCTTRQLLRCPTGYKQCNASRSHSLTCHFLMVLIFQVGCAQPPNCTSTRSCSLPRVPWRWLLYLVGNTNHGRDRSEEVRSWLEAASPAMAEVVSPKETLAAQKLWSSLLRPIPER